MSCTVLGTSCTVWVRKSPLRCSDIFSQAEGIFKPNFTCLYVPIYARHHLFSYLQLRRSYAILSAIDHPVHVHHAQNVNHRPKRTLGVFGTPCTWHGAVYTGCEVFSTARLRALRLICVQRDVQIAKCRRLQITAPAQLSSDSLLLWCKWIQPRRERRVFLLRNYGMEWNLEVLETDLLSGSCMN